MKKSGIPSVNCAFLPVCGYIYEMYGKKLIEINLPKKHSVS